MTSPIDQRLSEAQSAPEGHLVPSGIRGLKASLDGNATAFANWRRHPMTRRVLSALQDAVIHTPSNLSADDRTVQYGMTQGLIFAMQLIADPSAIWPGVFGKNTNEYSGVKDIPLMDFDTSIDDAIDGFH